MSGNDDRPAAAPDADLWASLRRLTAARIGLKRSGASLSTVPSLEFQLAHARARDAVHAEFDQQRLAADLVAELGGFDVLALASAAADKQTYLMRPDLGRTLSTDAGAALKPYAGPYDVVVVVSDGLSAGAIQSHAAPVMGAFLPALRAEGWRIAPLVIVRHGRVAIGDRVATLLSADCVVVLIGERPGLSAPDSMGAYLTWRPNAQTSDANRNCISNIRPDGIGYADAAIKLAHLLRIMRARRFSGVRLKDNSGRLQIGGA